MLVQIRPKVDHKMYEQSPEKHCTNQSMEGLVNNLEVEPEELGFKSGQQFHVPQLDQSNEFQNVIVESNLHKHVIVSLNTSTFKKVKRYMNTPMIQHNNSLLADISQTQIVETKQCRICLEDSQSNLIIPCKCLGSVQYVHEDCLKTWLLKKYTIDQITDNQIQCEICKTQYESQIIMRTYLLPQLILQQPSSLIYCLIFSTIVSLLFVSMACYLTAIFQSTSKYYILFVTLQVLGYLIGCTLFIMTILTIYELLIVNAVQQWTIRCKQEQSIIPKKCLQKSNSDSNIRTLQEIKVPLTQSNHKMRQVVPIELQTQNSS